ncbi:ABC transporter substrate-binding protein [Rhodococcoides kyotonense]|uniref:Iron complex transport system substrate-binding protein n=1 Tax=Rhodococcoides kyotonense TaxID=398843 RepID=A0A239DWB6_9NOCA|nr:iron-siderophore ABC transporter substrate-binding protein [Rhodococcus kyotonensis]SNS36796.1 iron complex transport system substrate-binding protein [Rhodococcus kyotonensis]
MSNLLVKRSAVAALTVVALAGCSATAAEEAPSTAEMRTVEHLYGTTEIPVDPQRVVVLDAGGVLESVLALGVTPVATVVPKSTGTWPDFIAEKLPDDVASVGNSEADVSVEEVIKADPDLIVVTSEDASQREFYDNVKDVAPTVAVGDVANEWKETLTILGDHLGKQDQAAQLLAGYDARVDAVRGQLGPNPGTASVIRVRADKLNYMGQEGAFIWTTLREVGLRAPTTQSIGTAEDSFFEVSLEQTNLLDADRIFVVTDGAAAEPGQFLETVRSNPLFGLLEGDIEYLPSNAYLFGSIMKAEAMLDVLESGTQ